MYTNHCMCNEQQIVNNYNSTCNKCLSVTIIHKKFRWIKLNMGF